MDPRKQHPEHTYKYCTSRKKTNIGGKIIQLFYGKNGAGKYTDSDKVERSVYNVHAQIVPISRKCHPVARVREE
jgi:hypothetical protein